MMQWLFTILQSYWIIVDLCLMELCDLITLAHLCGIILLHAKSLGLRLIVHLVCLSNIVSYFVGVLHSILPSNLLTGFIDRDGL